MISLDTKIDINSIEKLENYIKDVDRYKRMISTEKFKKYFRNKCLTYLKEYASNRLQSASTTNEEDYSDYISSIHIPADRITDEGFEIISDLVVYKPDTHHSKGYEFSISLAFEYGTGITGMGSADAPSWYRYDVNNNVVIANDEETLGWWIPAEIAGDTLTFGESRSGKSVVTRGYEGLEIFRLGAAEIQSKVDLWILEYMVKN